MKLFLFFFVNLFIQCGPSLENQILKTPETNPIQMHGNLHSMPKILQSKNLNLEIRFYNCKDKDFGKMNSGSGIYPKKAKDCRLNFSKENFPLNSKDFSYPVKTPDTWTHGLVWLQGIDSIRGKFSPGENPFWFHPDDLENGKIQVNFHFKSQENPIPDKEQYRLAERFSPIIILKKDKKYIPTNLSKYANNHSIKNTSGNKESNLYELKHALKDENLQFEESLYGKGDTHIYFHARYADTFVSGTSSKALPGWRDNYNYSYNRGNGDIVISYYLWYDYNEGPSPMGNKHEGDFESYAVLIDSKGKPKRFMVTGHDHVMLDTVWTNINSFENHPLLFIAHGRANTDGGNPTSPYGNYSVSLNAGSGIANLLANPVDVFPDLDENAQIILPSNLDSNDLKALRLGPGEWIDKDQTRIIDASQLVTQKIKELVKWEEPGWINQEAVSDPDKTHFVEKDKAFFMDWNGRLGRHPTTSLRIITLTQYGKSPVNPPFKMNDEQHFTYEKPKSDRCEKGRKGDYCPKFIGDAKTPQFKEKK
jgi:hypothetical protein